MTLAPVVEAHAIRRAKSFTCADVCRETNRYWAVARPSHKTALSKRIARVLENLLAVGYFGMFQLVSKRGHLLVEVLPAATRAAMVDANGLTRRLMATRKIALEEMQRKLDAEKRDRQAPLFPDAVLPPEKPRRRRRNG